MNAKSIDDDFFIKNAIACWLYHFPEHKWAPIYTDLVKRDFIAAPEPTPRPARKARSPSKTTNKKTFDGAK